MPPPRQSDDLDLTLIGEAILNALLIHERVATVSAQVLRYHAISWLCQA